MVADPDPRRAEVARLKNELERANERAADCERLLRDRATQIEDLRAALGVIRHRYPHLFAGGLGGLPPEPVARDPVRPAWVKRD